MDTIARTNRIITHILIIIGLIHDRQQSKDPATGKRNGRASLMIDLGRSMNRIIVTLFASIETKYIDIDFLNRWASKVIAKLPVHDYWVDSLACCQSLEYAEIAINEKLYNSRIDVGECFPRLLIGFLYLKLRKGELTQLDFESELVDIADAYDVVGLDIDYISVALSSGEWDSNFQQLLEGLAQESSDKFRQVEELAN